MTPVAPPLLPALSSPLLAKKECRLPVSRILSTPVLPEAGRSFLSTQLALSAPLARSATNTRE